MTAIVVDLRQQRRIRVYYNTVSGRSMSQNIFQIDL